MSKSKKYIGNSYAYVEAQGIRVDLGAYFRTPEGRKAFLRVAQSSGLNSQKKEGRRAPKIKNPKP